MNAGSAPRATPSRKPQLGERSFAVRLLDFEETDGVTTVSFTHGGLWDEEAVRAHEDGWGRILDNLRRELEAARPEG
jgi:uncharacterized protein YndB with AHSA1/START domain